MDLDKLHRYNHDLLYFETTEEDIGKIMQGKGNHRQTDPVTDNATYRTNQPRGCFLEYLFTI